MKLGFLTACLPKRTLEEIARIAEGMEYKALEVAAWPDEGDRPFVATHIDVATMTPDQAESIHGIMDSHHLTLSSLAYYDNNLHPDPLIRGRIHQHLYRCIQAAAELSCPTVGTFIGRDPNLSVSQNLVLAEEIFKPIVNFAGERQIKIVIENCVMEGWHPDGYPGNLAYSPELWEWMFELGLYLNYDPSHLVWIGIDPIEAVRPYIDRVAHVQAKDIELDTSKRNRFGTFGKTRGKKDPWDLGWWRYRVPGLGEVDWPRLVDTLIEGGFDGVFSVEHEDPVWGGTEERILRGLRISRRTLSPLVEP